MAGNLNSSDSISVALDLQPHQAGAALTSPWTCHPHPRGTQQLFLSSLLHLMRAALERPPAPQDPGAFPGSSQPNPRLQSSLVAAQVPSGLPCQSSRDPRPRCHLFEQDCISLPSLGPQVMGPSSLYLTGWPGVRAADPLLLRDPWVPWYLF